MGSRTLLLGQAEGSAAATAKKSRVPGQASWRLTGGCCSDPRRDQRRASHQKMQQALKRCRIPPVRAAAEQRVTSVLSCLQCNGLTHVLKKCCPLQRSGAGENHKACRLNGLRAGLSWIPHFSFRRYLRKWGLLVNVCPPSIQADNRRIQDMVIMSCPVPGRL